MKPTEQGEEEYCENCGRPMVLKKGRFGQFYACSGYPDCKTTKQSAAQQKKADVPLEETCPQLRQATWFRSSGASASSSACSNYPKCKYVKQKTIGVKCPNCSEGEIVERRSKRGKTFYGCNRYPECDFVAWGKPLPEKCPECGNPYLVEKWLKAGPVAHARIRSASTSATCRSPSRSLSWRGRPPKPTTAVSDNDARLVDMFRG